MKKISITIICGVIVCALVATGIVFLNKADDGIQNNQNSNSEQGSTSLNVDAELLDPTMDWWELYNPNGFDTLTAVLSNPNGVAVDVTYDVVYYKNGKEVYRNDEFANFSIEAGGKSIVWANYDIPKKSEVDDIKLENIIVTNTSYAPIFGKYKYTGRVENQDYFELEFEKKPTLATVFFLLYNDNNKNGQFDKGEIVCTDTRSTVEQKDEVSIYTDVTPYTNFEVYINAY